MPELRPLSSAEDERNWFALVAASPRVELEEGVAVALLIGIGHVTRLEFLPELPRLRGIATVREAAVYERILKSLSDRVARGIQLAELKSLIGPQLRVLRLRTLYSDPSDEVIAQLKIQYLTRPQISTSKEEARALRTRSAQLLDRALEASVPLGVEQVSAATPRSLYERKFDQHVGFKIPTVTRVVRLVRADVLVESVLVVSSSSGRPLREVVGRASLVFFSYKRIREQIQALAGRHVELIGVVHKTEGGFDATTAERRDWVRHLWGQDALVIDGDREDERTKLRAVIRDYHGAQ
jgi:hypothetical protein